MLKYLHPRLATRLRRVWRRLWFHRRVAMELAPFKAWSVSRGFALRVVPGEWPGCAMEGRLADRHCRIEWGPTQRPYMGGPELRLMAEVDLPRDLVLMLLNRDLQEWMESTVYAQYVDDVQTRVDTDTPIEMRWLVMFSRAGEQELGRLQARYGAVSNLMPWLARWLGTAFNDALAGTMDSTPADQPVVLTIKGGRLLLRTRMVVPDASDLVQWASVFEHALREAQRMGSAWRESQASGPQTQPHAWTPRGRTASLAEVDIRIPLDQT